MSDEDMEAAAGCAAVAGVAAAAIGATWLYLRLIAVIVTAIIG